MKITTLLVWALAAVLLLGSGRDVLRAQSVKHVTVSQGSRLLPTLASDVLLVDAASPFPAVATTHADRIGVSWWDPTAARWRTWLSEVHTPLRCNGGDLEMLSTLSWSSRVGFFALGAEVLLVARRDWGQAAPGTLRVHRFPSDAEGGLAPPAIATVPPPEQGRRGHAFWAGPDPAGDRLVVLSQVDRGDEVVLVVQHASRTADLADPAAWSSVDLAAGGFALDARIEDGVLHVVHRTTPYAWSSRPAEVSAPWPDLADWSVTLGPEDAEPLRYEAWRLADGERIADGVALPGGAHPRIQSVSPLRVTVDQLSEATVALEPPRSADQQFGRLAPRIGDWVKTLVEHAEDGPRTGPLFRLAGDRLPRTATAVLGTGVPRTRIAMEDLGDGTSRVHLGGFWPLLPVRLLATSDEDDKQVRLDLLRRNPARGTLEVTRYLVIDSGEDALSVQAEAYTTLDINRRQLDRVAGFPVFRPETEQFAPFIHRPYPWPPGGVGVLTFLEPDRRIDNAIGGAAGVADTTGLLCAYTDLGDGGLRVLRFDAVPTPSSPIPAKQFDVESIEVGDDDGRRWIEWRPGEGAWAPVLLARPSLTVQGSMEGTWALGIQPYVDLFDARISDVSPDEWLDRSDLQAIQAGITSSPLAPFSFEAELGGDRTLRVSMTPAQVFAGSPVSLVPSLVDGAGDPVLDDAIASVTWSFCEGCTPVTTAGTASASWNYAAPADPGAYARTVTIRVEAVLASGDTVVAVQPVTVYRALADTLWIPQRLIADVFADVLVAGQLRMSLGQYTFEYRRLPPFDEETEAVAPFSVRWTYRDDEDFWIRLRGAPDGQGFVDTRARMVVEALDVVAGLLPGIFRIDRAAAWLAYERTSTPGVDMSEVRQPTAVSAGSELLFDGAWRSSGLTVKPMTRGSVAVQATDVDLSFPTFALSVVVVALLTLGLAVLAAWVMTQLGLLAAVVATGNLILAAVVAVVIGIVVTLAVEFLAGQMLAGILEQRAPEIARRMDEVEVTAYSGELVAEEIAQRLLRAGQLGPDPSLGDDQPGERVRDRTWEMIVVEDGAVRALVRTPPGG